MYAVTWKGYDMDTAPVKLPEASQTENPTGRNRVHQLAGVLCYRQEDTEYGTGLNWTVTSSVLLCLELPGGGLHG